MSTKMVKGMTKGKGGSVDTHSATSTVRRLARLESLVDELVGANFPEQLESVRQKITNEIMEREVQDKVLHTYIKTMQLQPSGASVPAPSSAQGTPYPPPCSVAEAAELSAQQEVVRTQLFAVSQVFQRDLSALQRCVNELRERVDIVESPTKARGDAAVRAAENSVRAIEQQAASPVVGAQTASSQQPFCTQAQVELLLTGAISEARTSWRADIEHEILNVNERKAELGRVLVKEFERSIVGTHAKRLAAAEDKLQSICVDLSKVQSSTEALSLSARSTKDTGSSQHTSQHSMHSQNTQVDLDLSPLHTEMERLVGVVQGLQMQSEQVMGMLEQGKIALQKEVQTRMQEDQRIEGIVKEQLASVHEKSNGNGELTAMIERTVGLEQLKRTGESPNPDEIRKNLQEIISKVDGKSLRDAGDAATSGEPSTQGVATDASSAVKKPGDSSHLLEDLRSTILTYFRSEFQDYVGETLQKMGSSTPSSQIGTPQPPHPRMSREFSPQVGKWQDVVSWQSTGNVDLSGSVQSAGKASPRPDATSSAFGFGSSLTLAVPPFTTGAKVQLPTPSPEAIAGALMGKTFRPAPGTLQIGANGMSRTASPSLTQASAMSRTASPNLAQTSGRSRNASPNGQPRSVGGDVVADRLEAVRRAGNTRVSPHIEAAHQTVSAYRAATFGTPQTMPSDAPVAAPLQKRPKSRSSSASPTRSSSMDATAELGASVKIAARTSRNSTPRGKSLGSISSAQASTSLATPVHISMMHSPGTHSPRRPSSTNTMPTTTVRQTSYPFAKPVPVQPTVVQPTVVLKARPVGSPLV